MFDRRWKYLFLCCILLGALAIGAGHFTISSEAAARARGPSSFVGITPQTTLHRHDLRLMRRTGVGALRFPIYWSLVEPAPGAFDWSSVDAFLVSTARYGFDRLPFIWGSPSWLSGKPSRRCPLPAPRCRTLRLPVHNRRQRREWSAFLRALVGRYGPSGTFWAEHPRLRPIKPIRTWQIWNEENDHRFAEASVGGYAALLRLSAPAIRSVDPGARIVLGGLYATPRVRPSLDATTFLRRLYRRGAGSLFDDAALHPYTPDPSAMAMQIAALRAVMKRHRQGYKGLYITEFGWGSQTRAAGGDKFEKGPATQAAYAERAWEILFANRRRWNLQAAYWFTWQDIPAVTTRCDFCDSNGLLDLDGYPKPALRSFARAVHRIG